MRDVRATRAPSSSRRKPGPTDTARSASARVISVPHPGLPASAGTTKGEGAPLTPNTVIPAQAGIHTRGPSGSIAAPARLDPRLRGDDEADGARVAIIRTTTRSPDHPHATPPSSSRRKPGPMDTAQPASARAISIPRPWLPAPAGMTKGEGAPISPNRSSPRRRGSIVANLAAPSRHLCVWIPASAGMTRRGRRPSRFSPPPRDYRGGRSPHRHPGESRDPWTRRNRRRRAPSTSRSHGSRPPPG